MPCRTDDYYDSNNYPSGPTQSDYNKLKAEADNVTKLLCSVMGKLEKFENLSLSLSKIDGLTEWWEHHKEVDRKRIEKEVQEAQKALSSLSKEAKELLIKRLRG